MSIDLNDPAALAAADPADMLGAIARLPDDAEAGYAAGLAAARDEGLPSADDLHSVTFCGMGGSAVAGDVARALFTPRLTVPIDVVRSSRLPEHAETRTLVIATSHSGETAETLACFQEAVDRGCRVIAITSGGELARRAEAARVPIVPVPAGGQPRAALGSLAFTTLGVLEALGLVPTQRGDVEEAVRVMRALVAKLGPKEPGNLAKRLADQIGRRTAVVWGAEGIGSLAAMRWKCQINENGKLPAFWSSMSELDHNEIVGWTDGSGAEFFLLLLRHAGEEPGIAERFTLSRELVQGPGALDSFEIEATGASPLARLCSLIVTGDYLSTYLALRRGIDPTPVEVIQALKRALAT